LIFKGLIFLNDGKAMVVFKLIVTLFFFYSLVQPASSREISRIPRIPAKESFSFGVIADIQYADAEKNGARDYRNSLKKLDKCIGEFNRHNLSFVVNLGDMIDHDYLSFDKPLEILAHLKASLYNVIGNHDFEVDDQFKDKIRKRLGNKNGYFDFTVNDVVFVVLDGSDISTFSSLKGSKIYNTALTKSEELKKRGLNNAFTWNGGIGDKQLDWLGKLLEKADKLNKRVIIFCHWPLLPENGTQLWNNREVLNLINNHHSVVAWIAGHHHAGGYVKSGNIHHLTIKGMVEARSETSCGIMEIYPDKLLLTGYGDQNDQILEITR